MNTGPKLALYGLALAGMLGVGAVVGAAAGPIHVGGDAPTKDMGSGSHDTSPTTLPRRIGPQQGSTVVLDGNAAVDLMPADDPRTALR